MYLNHEFFSLRDLYRNSNSFLNLIETLIQMNEQFKYWKMVKDIFEAYRW